MKARVIKPTDSQSISTAFPFKHYSKDGQELPHRSSDDKQIDSDTHQRVADYIKGEVRQTELAVGYCYLRNFREILKNNQEDRAHLAECLNEYLEGIDDIVLGDLGGTLKFYEGGMVYFFGHYATKEDPVTKAIIAGLKIRYRMNKFNRRWNFYWDDSWKVSCGVSHGQCAIAGHGTPEQIEWTVKGKTVNLVKNLGGAAGAGQILITDSAYQNSQFHKDLFTFNKPFHIQPKDSDIAIQVREVISMVK